MWSSFYFKTLILYWSLRENVTQQPVNIIWQNQSGGRPSRIKVSHDCTMAHQWKTTTMVSWHHMPWPKCESGSLPAMPPGFNNAYIIPYVCTCIIICPNKNNNGAIVQQAHQKWDLFNCFSTFQNVLILKWKYKQHFVFLFVSARICEAVQAGGPVDPAGCVQMAEETLSQSAPDLQRLLQTARHHRYNVAFSLTCTEPVMRDGPPASI